jgi:condensin complex subunit 3
VIEFLLQVLGNEESDKVQALICAGFAKLMLSGMISDERVCFFTHGYKSPL